MNGLPFLSFFAFTLLGEGVFAAINWLWIAGAVAAVWLLLSAMSRRQVRLTGLLRDHVKKTQDAQMPPESAAPTEEPES